jgi:glucose-6-phosphate 1-dehydrogenase
MSTPKPQSSSSAGSSNKSDNKSHCHFIIFGATGNLVREKLLPALYELEITHQLEPALRFVAFARREMSTSQWEELMRETLTAKLPQPPDAGTLEKLCARFDYVAGDYTNPDAYRQIKILLAHAGNDCDSTVFYLAISPNDFHEVITQLHDAGFSGVDNRHRIVVEKPFGEDIDSARRLNTHLHKYFSEEQIYRIDHYLGKETVQNLLVFRFANTLIEPVWNRHYIDHVQITVAENHGIEGRAGYYDQAGALRDMLQNHMMQLLSVVAMEPPATLDADALRDEKVKVLRSIRPIPKRGVNNFAFRAQYGAGHIDRASVPAYQAEDGVADKSTTETYVAAKFYIDNWRWSGVPFYLRTGKRLAQKMSQISICFKHPPKQLFRETPVEDLEPNWVVLSLQPHEAMHLEVHTKQPGLGMDIRTTKLVASYRKDNERGSDAYETLLLDIMEGDRSLFIRFDEVEWSWRVVDPILRHWSLDNEFIHTYPAGSWGPEEASRLFDSESHSWRNHL